MINLTLLKWYFFPADQNTPLRKWIAKSQIEKKIFGIHILKKSHIQSKYVKNLQRTHTNQE